MSTPTPVAICGSFSFDSVIAPDGRPLTGKVGGNALWSSLGALISGVAPRIVTVVGDDYPGEVVERLQSAGIDTSAVARIDRAHPVRLTFAHLPDGGRLQPVPAHMLAGMDAATRAQFIDTTTDPETLALGAPTPALVPDAWLDEIAHWHLPLLPLVRHRAMVAHLSGARGTLQTDCPARSDLLDAPYERLEHTVGDIDYFLPSTSDFDVIDPDATIDAVIVRLRDSGAGTIVLKAGADGVLIVDGAERWLVPAHPDEPIDPTGAGDAFCGGFLAGRARGLDIVAAAALGAAAASFAVSVTDPLDLLDVAPSEVEARAHELRAAAHPHVDVLQGGIQ
ncbi:carbohydrate kinase family protein [Microbacterium thalassium]|uniref:Ribokinase n=1 Tax=Microbacterium thalassium TaxID=362649 RepID=A0A7X0KTW7_9MICO|nr:PfkB family carbohydrate kinase [Microbacterium thalassium]MBB6390542.1 ribokinase [Microbacterium thalassium]